MATTKLQSFVHFHDDIPAFHATYLVLTVLTAALFNLGAFAVVILAHMCLDIVKYRDHHRFTWRETWEGVVRENLVDVTLLSVGVVFAVYLDSSAAVAGISGLMRAELSLLRFIALFVTKMKILHHFLKVIAHLHHYMESVHPKHKKGWSSLDKWCFLFLLISIGMVYFADVILALETGAVSNILSEELVPWNI